VIDLFPVLIIAVLILLNGLFVAAEFAIVGAPRATIERLASQGHRSAGTVQKILSEPRRQDQFIATAQLGITLTSLGLGMYGELVLAHWIAQELQGLGASRWIAAHTVASVVAVIILTYFHIVLGEMVPKSLALQQPHRIALWVTPLIEFLKTACYPVVLGLNGLGNLTLKLIGVSRQSVGIEHFHTPEELEYIVRESQEGGLLRRESAQVLQELFKFGDLTAREVMVPRVKIIAIAKGTPFSDLETILRSSPHTRYPVYESDLDHIIGMVHIKDLLRELLHQTPKSIEFFRPVPHVPESMPIDSVLSAMRRLSTQMVVVMDEHGGTAGLLTVEDLFEEVIGGIDDGAGEHPKIRQDSIGRLYVAGTVRLDEIGQKLNQVLEHDEVDTVSGLILGILGRPPKVGDVVIYHQFRFEVTAVEGRGVKECVVSLASGKSEQRTPG
jgi:CBS domain containing-hemolysin-like protein